jgi:opacity protein-like surface antigen
MKSKIYFLLIPLLFIGTANANWEYPGKYARDGYYIDDGSKFIISLRGGGSVARGKVVNEIGTLSSDYYIYNSTGEVIPYLSYNNCITGGTCDAADFTDVGYGDIASLPAAKDFKEFSFAAGASIGWTLPNKPQWRMELGWDHISETEFNASPLFSGNLPVSSGIVLTDIQSGSAHASIKTDIISAMAFYDFFQGIEKPQNTFIPYIGFGLGYADSKTVLNLSDLYGDLSVSPDLITNYGVLDEYNLIQFYKSEKTNSNVAGVLALGFSYGLVPGMFLDMGVRCMYIPKIKFGLSDETDEKHRDWFSIKDMVYTNIMMGVRFEF